MTAHLIGALMVLLYTTSLGPQILKTWRLKSAEELHIWTPLSVATAGTLAIVYASITGGGIYLFIDYTASVLTNLTLVFLILKYRLNKKLDKSTKL